MRGKVCLEACGKERDPQESAEEGAGGESEALRCLVGFLPTLEEKDGPPRRLQPPAPSKVPRPQGPFRHCLNLATCGHFCGPNWRGREAREISQWLI